MVTSDRLVGVIGVGLPPVVLEELRGELDTYRRRPHRSGAPVDDRELRPLAVALTLSARLDSRTWDHLPTLVSPGCALVALGCANLAVQSHTDATPLLGRPAGYLPLIAILVGFAVLLVRSREVPARTVTGGSLAMAAAAVVHVLGSTPTVTADVVMGVALLGVITTLPVAWLGLVRRRRPGPLRWDELPAAIHDNPVTRVAWRAFALSLLALAAGELAFVLSTPGQIGIGIRLGLGANSFGLMLIGLGFAATSRRARRSRRALPYRTVRSVAG